MERARRVDARFKQLAELRVAAVVGCPFCLDIGSALLAEIGGRRQSARAERLPVERRVLARSRKPCFATPTA